MKMKSSTPVILVFGGLDPTGGAGILMDSRAACAAGAHACAVASCLTIQTTKTFSQFIPISRKALDDSLACVNRSFRLGAIKVGMVGTRAAAEAIFSFVSANRKIPLIVDPVLRSSSGFLLLAKSALPAYRNLIRTASVLTPNLSETEKLLDRKISSFSEAIAAAETLSETTGAAVVLKGGHFPWKGRKGIDIIASDGNITMVPPAKARRGDPHGTGCALAAALAARIAAGDAVVPALTSAKSALTKLVESGFLSMEGRQTLFP